MTALELDLDDAFAGEEPAEPTYAHPESVEELRVMYERAAHQLGGTLFGASIETQRADGSELYLRICAPANFARDMALALNWLLLDETPTYKWSGAPKARWVEEYLYGPWPSEPQP